MQICSFLVVQVTCYRLFVNNRLIFGTMGMNPKYQLVAQLKLGPCQLQTTTRKFLHVLQEDH